MFKKIAALATAAVLCAGLMAGCGIGHVSIEQVTSKLIPYFVTLVLALLAVTYIPALSLGLPGLMGLI